MKYVEPGCRVRLQFADEETEYFVCNPRDRKVAFGEISTDSPLGRELLGRKEGDQLILELAMGQTIECRVLGIESL